MPIKHKGAASATRELRLNVAPQRFTIRKNADGSRSISGYAAVFNSLSEDLGGFKEKIAPGAFTQSLRDNEVLCLYGHDDNQILGRTSSGTLQVVEDSKGLRFTCTLPDTSTARDLIALMERGDIRSMSFGFVVASQGGDSWSQDATGQTVRTLIQVVLFEISVVGQPAYTSTSVNLRSAPAAIRAKLKQRDEDDDDDLDAEDGADTDDDECDCECDDCMNDRCDRCSNDYCDNEACAAAGCRAAGQTRTLLLRLRHAQLRASLN